jgi:pimeloyl-ACP methyl ester carboxylesterase
MSETDNLSLAHLQAELARIDVLIQREVRRWQLAGQDPNDTFRGLRVSDDEALGLLERPFGASWGATAELGAEQAGYEADLAAAQTQIDEIVARAQRQDATLRLQHLVETFQLDAFDLDAFLICLAPTLFYDGWNVPWLHRMIPLVDYTPLKYFAYFREEPPYGLKDESLRERVARAYQGVSLRQNDDFGQHGYAHFPIRLLCESRHLIARCMGAPRRVKAPLLIVQARHDDATSPRNSRHIFENVGSMQKDVLLLDNSFHMVTADLERDRVASAMARFCQSVTDKLGVPTRQHANV